MGSSIGIIILVIIATITLVAIILLGKLRKNNQGVVPEPVEGCKHAATGGCCGGVNCERKKKQEALIVYFEDEELDRFVGRSPEAYTDKEIQEFREVYETLRPEEISPWLNSLKLRQLELPISIAREIEEK